MEERTSLLMFLLNSWMHNWQFSLQTFIGLQLFTSCVTSVHGMGMFTMGSVPHGPVKLQKITTRYELPWIF
jgi:hypothetical protein